MRISIPKKQNPNIEKYRNEDITIVNKFAQELYKELGVFLKAVILFGSSARNAETVKSDIDVLVVVDDLSITMTPEVVEAYKIIVKKKIIQVSTKLHVTSLRLTNFWEYMRAGDPVGINILRDGVPIIDVGFFEPLQALLKKGRIRPSRESIWTYFVRAPNSLQNSKWHIIQATIDLYWAVIDSAHSCLMKLGELPPSPEHVSSFLREKMVKKKLLDKKYALTMEKFYRIMKDIMHREVKGIKGSEYDKLYREAEEFVNKMRSFIEDKQKK